MDSKQKNLLSITAILVLVAVAVWLVWPPQEKIRQGLDIQGGVSVILTASALPGQQLTDDKMERAETVIQARVNGLGASEASVQRQGSDSILVQLPGIKDQQQALEALGSTGLLEFVDVSSLPGTATANVQEGDRLERGTYEPVLTGDVVQDAAAVADEQGNPAVTVTFDRRGSDAWAEYTGRNVGRQVAIVLDGVVQSAPTIQEAITGGQTRITGNFTAADARRLAAILQAGALPVELTPANTQSVGPTLGQEALNQGLLAGLAGLAIVAVFMLVFYRALGVVSWFSLAFFGVIFMGVLAVMSQFGAFALTLPGIAGIVLTIGVATDTSILIFERFKEEVGMGKTPRSAAKSSSRHALGTSLNADVVTLITALFLFWVAIGPVRGFALTLIIGIAIDLTVAFLFTRPVVILLAESVAPKAPWLFGLKGGADNA